jgi:hypothetical protein
LGKIYSLWTLKLGLPLCFKELRLFMNDVGLLEILKWSVCRNTERPRFLYRYSTTMTQLHCWCGCRGDQGPHPCTGFSLSWVLSSWDWTKSHSSRIHTHGTRTTQSFS